MSSEKSTLADQSCEELDLTEFEKVAYAINYASKGLSTILGKAVSDSGLSGQEASVLLKLGSGLKNPTAIAAVMGVDASNLSRLSRKLESRSLVKREVDDTNRTRAILTLTARGKQLLREIQPQVRAKGVIVESALTPKEIKSLKSLLGKLCDAVLEES